MSPRRAESLIAPPQLGISRHRRRFDQRGHNRRADVAAFEEWQRSRPSSSDSVLSRLMARRRVR
jgi:hypothetical protein